tara:strand:+ start:63 stop:227 length:165 start_codon:yes stop_codon:yes gene_type:complete
MRAGGRLEGIREHGQRDSSRIREGTGCECVEENQEEQPQEEEGWTQSDETGQRQ